jgi:predicted metal-dependent hydrolase
MPRSFTAAPRREILLYNNHPVNYTLVFRSRRTIGFAVRPDGSVHVSAPAGTSREWVAQQVLKKADWILKHQASFASRPAPAPSRRYEAGSLHYYQGQPYRLRFAEAHRLAVAVAGDELVVSAPAALEPAQTEALIHSWYTRQAGPQFAESLARVWPRFAAFNLARPALFVRNMRTRWGSCTPRTGRIASARNSCAPAPNASTTCCCTSAAICWSAITPKPSTTCKRGSCPTGSSGKPS